MLRASRWSSLLVALLIALPASGQNVIDQSQPSAQGGWAWLGYWTGVGVYQTFKPGASNITGAGFYLFPGYEGAYGGTANVTINLRNSPETAILATSTVLATSTGWVDAFWNAVAVTPRQTYSLDIISDERDYGFLASYEGNGAYVDGVAVLMHDYFDQGGGSYYSGADMTFRTYKAADVVATPEPSALMLLASGMVVVVLSRRFTARRAQAHRLAA